MRLRGFTLAEVMVGLLIVSLAVLAMVSVQAYAFRAQTKGTGRNRASLLAASRLGAIEAALKEDFAASVDSARTVVEPGYELAVGSSSVLVSLKEVLVSVYWVDDQGPHEYDLRTRVLKP